MRRHHTALRALQFCLAVSLIGGCDDISIDLDDDAGDASGDGSGAADVDTPPSAWMTPQFAASGDGFYRMPWPHDARLRSDGYVDLSDFPPVSAPLLRQYVAAVQGNVRGYSIMPVVYVKLDGAADLVTLPEPRASLEASGPVQLMDVSPEGCGDRVPVEVRLNRTADATIDADVLMVSPVPGFVLRPATPYALLVLPSLGSADSLGVATAPESAAALRGEHPDADVNAATAPARACLPEAGVPLDAVAVATVFTTQDPLGELFALRQAAAVEAAAPDVDTFAYDDTLSRAAYATYRGTYQTPIYQQGTSPYATTGGGIVFDADGRPAQTRTETVPFTVVAPRPGDGPFPLLIWVDGTGADDTSWVTSRLTQDLLRAGFVVAGYTAQFHGSRATPGANEELHSFNFSNPDAFRNTFRQQVADTVYFVRLMTEGAAQLTDLPALDVSRVVYAGQSQGSLIGTMVAAVEPRIDAYVLNGVAGYLATVAVSRKDPFDIQALVARLAQIPADFDRFHPLMALAQMGGDATDPHAFAPAWSGSDAHPDGAHVLLINGLSDTTSSVDGMNAVAIAGGAAPVRPAGWDIDPFGVWDVEPLPTPVSANRVAMSGRPLTHAVVMSATTGHFTIYDVADIRASAVGFLTSALDGVATYE